MRPVERLKVIPITPLTNLFWSPPETQSIDYLRLKSITLLALAAMLRLSNIAPYAELYNASSAESEKYILKVCDINFTTDGMSINFQGIKNDSQRRGFLVHVNKSADQQVCPVMKDYINATQHQRKSDKKALFLTLNAPNRAILSSTVSHILASAISKADLHGFKPRHFRPTGGTNVVAAGSTMKQL